MPEEFLSGFCLVCGSPKDRATRCYTCGAPVLSAKAAKLIDESRPFTREGNTREAMRRIQQAIREQPDDFVARLRLAECYRDQSQAGDRTARDLAVREFETALKLIPPEAGAYTAILDVALSLGRVSALRHKLMTSPETWEFARRLSAEMGGETREGDYGQEHRIRFFGDARAFFWIKLSNFVLTVLTCGVYWFWGKVETRKYLLSTIEMDGDRLAYHGRGGEVLLGYIKAMILLVAGPYLIIQMFGLLSIILVPAYLSVFASMAVVGMFKYRLSRTSWRNIRFSFRGSAAAYGIMAAKGLILCVITLGFYMPFFLAAHRRYVMGNTWFGNRNLMFEGEGGELFLSFVAGYLLAPVSFGLSWAWYQVTKYQHFWNHTEVRGDNMGTAAARFRTDVQMHGYMLLKIENAVLLVLTLGLAYPWIRIRTLRYLLSNLSVEGSIDWSRVEPADWDVTATGEGALSVFGLDLDLG